ncbi:MAG: hypothetical protein ACYCWW_02000 [Deltaproteobacteria bacterium]
MSASVESTELPLTGPADPALTRSQLTPEAARRLAWRRLAVATLIAGAVAAALFAGIWYMPFGDGAFTAFAEWFYHHSAILLVAALSPLMASLLVGYGYMGRAMRRRAAEKAAEAGPRT